jgi:hypothetical protein
MNMPQKRIYIRCMDTVTPIGLWISDAVALSQAWYSSLLALWVWNSRVQPTIALSTAESEFLAASNTGCFGIFIRSVLDELLQQKCEATNV